MSLLQELKHLDYVLSAPFFPVLLQVFYCTAANLFIHKIAAGFQRYKEFSIFFPIVCALSGYLELHLFSTPEKAHFVLTTSMFYGSFFFLAIMFRDMGKERIKKIDGILKFFVLCYAIVVFRIYHHRSDFADYIVTFCIMTVKLISAGVSMQIYTFHEMTQIDIKYIPTGFEVFAYEMYSGWPTFGDFLHMRGRVGEPNPEWKRMTFCAGSKSILFKILSYKPLKEHFVAFVVQMCVYYNLPIPGRFPMFGNYLIKSIFHAFQLRCNYYFQAQLAEMQVIVAGLKSGQWNKYVVFDFIGAEFSIINSDFFVCSNVLLGSYIRNQFKIYSDSGMREIFVNLATIVGLVMCCHFYYGLYIGLFIITMFTQQIAYVSYSITGKCDCHMYDTHPNYGLTKPNSYMAFCKTILPHIFYNQLRLATLFYPFQTGFFFPSIVILLASILYDIWLGRVTQEKWNPPPGCRRRDRPYYNF